MGLDRLRSELESPALPGMLVAVLDQDGGEATIGTRPALQLVVVGLGQHDRVRRELRVLIHLRLPAVGDRRRQVAAEEDRNGIADLRGQPARVFLGGAEGLYEMRGRRVDLAVDTGS